MYTQYECHDSCVGDALKRAENNCIYWIFKNITIYLSKNVFNKRTNGLVMFPASTQLVYCVRTVSLRLFFFIRQSRRHFLFVHVVWTLEEHICIRQSLMKNTVKKTTGRKILHSLMLLIYFITLVTVSSNGISKSIGIIHKSLFQ